MTINEFIREFEESVLDVEPGTIQEETVLTTVEEWDSMARVALNAVLDTHFGFTLNSDELKDLVTFSDIVNKLDGKLEG
ncbi:acyl carrier protein [Salmonella enterica subsp. enterica]|nr:acyl carrier protein [Salmonella enterica subsp. enterica serovar Typhi]ECH9276403.1 acyl carrier protein [Salmonella enterica subsp. enterica]